MNELNVENVVKSPVDSVAALVSEFKHAAKELKQTDTELKQVEINFKKLKESKKQQKRNFKVKFAQVVCFIGRNEAATLAKSLYWDEGRFLPQGEILAAFKKAFGHGSVNLSKSFSISCDQCRKTYDHMFKSWTEYDNHFRKGRWTRAAYCPSCEQTKQNEYQKKYQEEYKLLENEMKKRKQLLIDLKNLPYNEYLKTDHWKSVRKDALKRSKYRCQLCNNNTSLQVHHRTYENLGNEHYGDLIALCQTCHEKHHNIPSV